MRIQGNMGSSVLDQLEIKSYWIQRLYGAT